MDEPAGPTCAPPGAAPGLAYTLAFLAFFAHGLTVIARLPDWAGARGVPLDTPSFANWMLALVLVAAVVFLVGRTLQFARPVQLVVAGATGALLSLAALTLTAALATLSLAPGLLTGLLLVVPSATWLLKRLPLSRAERSRAGLSGAVVMLVIAGAALWLSRVPS